ncbi:unnamed protein product [Schistosoma margrebowiei]|uniref:Uncharacterized protein n=1 Tax=Schistosoma margrebowiei TaxID=48269 RepID=A0A183MQX1_9TREM|nr:unnamed protein product [Schistosoma margrebowiei]
MVIMPTPRVGGSQLKFLNLYHFGSMTGSLQKKLNTHWARSVPDKRLAIQLLRVTPFIFTASRSTMGSLLCCDVEEPFAVLSTSNQEFHTNATVFSQMIGVLPLRKKAISKKKRVGVNKKCDFLGPCSNIPPTEDPPQQYSPLKTSSKTSFTVDSLPGVFAVDKPTNYLVTNSSTVIENKENIPITEASIIDSTSPFSKDSSLFKDLFDSNDDYSMELTNLSNNFMTSEILTPSAKLSPNNNTNIITSTVAHSLQASLSESQENKSYSPSTQYFSVQNGYWISCAPLAWNQGFAIPLGGLSMSTNPVKAPDIRFSSSQFRNTTLPPREGTSDVSNLKTSISSVTEINPDGQFVQGIKRKFSPKGTWVKPLMGRILKPISGNELQPDAKRPRKFASAHSPTALTSAITVSSPNISSISLTDTNSSLGNLGFSSYTLNRSKSYPCNPVNTPSSLPIVRFTERQRNPLHEVVSSSNSSAISVCGIDGIVTSSKIQHAHFVLLETRQLDILAFYQCWCSNNDIDTLWTK